jgi:hypothetical protein
MFGHRYIVTGNWEREGVEMREFLENTDFGLLLHDERGSVFLVFGVFDLLLSGRCSWLFGAVLRASFGSVRAWLDVAAEALWFCSYDGLV